MINGKKENSQFEIKGDGLLVRAPAKLNLSLLVVGKRPDGFHELETIMAKIDFYSIGTGSHYRPESAITQYCTLKKVHRRAIGNNRMRRRLFNRADRRHALCVCHFWISQSAGHYRQNCCQNSSCSDHYILPKI